jgi:glycosyltransferase involved in cell wall biosynthesis
LLADQLSRFLGENHPPIRVVPHGVWTVPDIGKAPALDERLGWKRLLSFGALRKNKGVDLLLRAAEHLPGYSITIAGEPIHAEYFQTEVLPLVRRLQAKGVTVNLMDHFIPDEQVGALFASHSAIVLPYTREFVAQSGVAFMALAYELPVVASEAGGLRDLFDEFKIGVTFREPTPQALAAAVKQLYSQESRQDLVKQIAAAKERYSWQQAARATIAGYALEVERASNAEDCPIAATATP